MQGLSGAGRSPGVIALDILDNIIPYIPKEEEKQEIELRKIFGTLAGGEIRSHPAAVSATCTRANVAEGHMGSVSASLGRKATLEQVRAAWLEYPNEAYQMGLPSMSAEHIHVHEDPYRPQPKYDRNRGRGMTTAVGRLREDRMLPNGVRFLFLTHNTRMGAAAGAVLVAEYLLKKGYMG
jgi:aspartate-semialdehyde dehydrogenase